MERRQGKSSPIWTWSPAPAGRHAHRRDHPVAQAGASVHREADRAGHDLRRPGGDRDRECAAVRRGAGAHARAVRGAGAADGDLRGACSVISSSPGELEPVFQAMLANATRICEAEFGSMWLGDGDPFRRVALHNAPQKFAEFSERSALMRSTDAPSLDRLVTDEAGGPRCRPRGGRPRSNRSPRSRAPGRF